MTDAQHLRQVGQLAMGLTPVHDADVLTDDERTDDALLSIVLRRRAPRVPPVLLGVLSEHNVGVHDVSKQNDHYVVLAC